MIDHVVSNDGRWHSALFLQVMLQLAAFRITFKGDKGRK
jgi:hypothetical protein